MKPNIRKISELTGFSPATVSNALNYKPGVRKSTAERVFEVAREIGYSVIPKIERIRFVIYKKSGLIVNDSVFFPAVMEGVERQAKALGYEIIFTQLDAANSGVKGQIQYLLEDTTTAMILLATEMSESDFRLFEHPGCHLLVLDGESDNITFDTVLIANTSSAFNAVNYLIKKGHKEIGYLMGSFRIKNFIARNLGYRRAMHRHELDIVPQYTVKIGTTLESAYKDMHEYLCTNPKLPTAYFADNDVVALGAMRALKEHGNRIPEDISIIGFDNLDYGEIMSPRLSTIHVYKQEMGEIAVRRLVDHVRLGSVVKTKIQVHTDFIERESVRDLSQ